VNQKPITVQFQPQTLPMQNLKIWIVGTVSTLIGVAAAAYFNSTFQLFLKLNWGNLASVVGLVLSFLAAFFAASASSASREARDSLLARTLEQEINDAHRLMSELITLVESGQLQLAARECSELLDVPTRIRIRWEAKLTTPSRDNLILAREQLDTIHSVLRKAAPPIGQREAERLLNACIEVRTIFAEEQALLMRNADRGDNGN
jgi:hypothetical protein